ncbi:glycosyltransferase [Sulfitobacter sp. W074]|uniref:MraY family glycosyltransferase n=1 Tax=Sulfitobacter sp. W074 TaxID=2867026 RepID=UPI0021A73294|nr:glycosyltransferase [Sulfitobacter sp. W074]UWR39600.1 glycosyltransferase [Sulfitobacter sp. W074]
MFEPLVFGAVFIFSMALSLLFIARPNLLMSHEHMLRDLSAPQSQHTRPTPRVGGIGIILGLCFGCLFYYNEIGRDLLLALAAGAVVFWAGLHEDIYRNVSPRNRLFAAFLSAALAIGVTGSLVPDLGLTDGALLRWLIPAVVITLLWSAGTCHALNLVDGLNGLSALYSMTASIGFIAIAGQTGDTDIQIVAGLLLVSVLGFFFLNWPFGRIFLGDAGAYGIGHILAWLGIILVARNPSVAGMAILLLLFWPVCDTLLSILRRRATRRATGQPDRLHFHHIAVRTVAMVAGRRGRFDNPIASLILAPFFSVPIAAGVLLWDQPILATIALACFILLFMVTYISAVKFFPARRFRRVRYVAAGSLGRRRSRLQVSPLSGIYVRESEVLDVRIFREAGKTDWTLQATAADNENVAYEGKFRTDIEAYDKFLKKA